MLLVTFTVCCNWNSHLLPYLQVVKHLSVSSSEEMYFSCIFHFWYSSEHLVSAENGRIQIWCDRFCSYENVVSSLTPFCCHSVTFFVTLEAYKFFILPVIRVSALHSKLCIICSRVIDLMYMY